MTYKSTRRTRILSALYLIGFGVASFVIMTILVQRGTFGP